METHNGGNLPNASELIWNWITIQMNFENATSIATLVDSSTRHTQKQQQQQQHGLIVL